MWKMWMHSKEIDRELLGRDKKTTLKNENAYILRNLEIAKVNVGHFRCGHMN
jgi:hypothetical protein